ncbi:MAG: AraC family transcriptional regulator [Pseudomonadota bacterium]
MQGQPAELILSFDSFGPFPFGEGGSIVGWHSEVSAGIHAVFGEMDLAAPLEQELREKVPGLAIYLPCSGAKICARLSGQKESYDVVPGRAYFYSSEAGPYWAKTETCGQFKALKIYLNLEAAATLNTAAARTYSASQTTPIYSEIILTKELTQSLMGVPDSVPAEIDGQLKLTSTITGIVSSVLRHWQEEDAGKSYFPRNDVDQKIARADECLRTALANPPSVLALANMVGLNHMTLKRGFRRVYGTTVYGRLRYWRMQVALSLLKDGNSVTQTALQVGYSNPSKFSSAFKREVGKIPSDVARTA